MTTLDDEALLQQRLLIVPTLPTALSNLSTSSFTLEESNLGGHEASSSQLGGNELAHEIAKASLTIAGKLTGWPSMLATNILVKRMALSSRPALGLLLESSSDVMIC